MSFVFKWLTPIHHRHCPGQTLLRWYHLRSLRQADVIGCHLDRFLSRAASNPGGQWIRGTANCGTVATPPCAANLAEQRHPNIGLAPVPGAHRASHPLLDKTPDVRKKNIFKKALSTVFSAEKPEDCDRQASWFRNRRRPRQKDWRDSRPLSAIPYKRKTRKQQRVIQQDVSTKKEYRTTCRKAKTGT